MRTLAGSAVWFGRAALVLLLLAAVATTRVHAQGGAPAASATTPVTAPPATPPPPATTPPAAAPAPAATGAASAQSATGVPSPAPNAPGVGPDYVVGPGDVLQVFVWRNPELTTTVPVRPDGKITTPLVQDMVAVGRTPAQLARDIETRLAEYVRSPQVSIIVTNAVSAYSQVTVVGQVKMPKSLPFREGMTVLDAVLETGGLTDFAAGNRARLIRKDAKGKQQQTKVHLDDMLKKGRLDENIQVRPGDVLLVPEAYF